MKNENIEFDIEIFTGNKKFYSLIQWILQKNI